MSKKPGKAKDRLATFLVRVYQNANEPWHGSIVWISGQCERNFSSMQELWELMDSKMCGGMDVEAQNRTDKK
ncbi:MAG: hypothetical protein RR475_10700 [Clostridia bacterium]